VFISLTTPASLLQSAMNRRAGRGTAGEASVEYSKIVPAHDMKVIRGIPIKFHTLLNKIKYSTTQPIYPPCEAKTTSEPVWTFRRRKFLVLLSEL